MHNIDVTHENYRFNYRVGAFITCRGRVLLQKDESKTFYNLPGGSVKFGETTKQAIIRELKEELNINISNAELINVSENFFQWMGNKTSELLFLYKVVLEDGFFDTLSGMKVKDEYDEYVKWFDLKNLKKLECKPAIIYELPKLTKLTHRINK